ncbi:hypothetical protein ACMFMG_001509 [Clarireedia jacksonii]
MLVPPSATQPRNPLLVMATMSITLDTWLPWTLGQLRSLITHATMSAEKPKALPFMSPKAENAQPKPTKSRQSMHPESYHLPHPTRYGSPQWDNNLGKASRDETAQKALNARRVPIPDSDPLFGKEGPLVQIWKHVEQAGVAYPGYKQQ